MSFLPFTYLFIKPFVHTTQLEQQLLLTDDDGCIHSAVENMISGCQQNNYHSYPDYRIKKR